MVKVRNRSNACDQWVTKKKSGTEGGTDRGTKNGTGEAQKWELIMRYGKTKRGEEVVVDFPATTRYLIAYNRDVGVLARRMAMRRNRNRRIGLAEAFIRIQIE